mmetsp:Transcript_12753/g.30986  ORF Transcript_12753/g.30986 Transcript_12753/m.30986 type:complete len:115 (-) Transcript_12753:1967-2311(-)
MRCSGCSVRARAHVAEAAAMMLQHRVHRLPVVDDRNVPIGIATRADIFEPLISKQQDLLTNQEQRRDTVLHHLYPGGGKFGAGQSWEEIEEEEIVDEDDDEDHLRFTHHSNHEW